MNASPLEEQLQKVMSSAVLSGGRFRITARIPER